MLQEILEKRIFFSEVKTAFDSADEQSNAFVNMLVLTSLRHLVYLRKILKQHITKKLPEKASFVNFVLLAAAAEIIYMETPDYAVINSYVDLAKKATDKYIAGFANAVLRKICTNKDEIAATDRGEFFTAPFFELLNLDYNKKTVQKIQAACLDETPLDLTAKHNPQELADKLGGQLLPLGTIRLPNRGKIQAIPEYQQGNWWVQDFSASLAVKTLGDIKGLRVLDLCAAPGGKTAQLINAGAKVTALDISEPRLKTLRENMQRLKLQAEEIICMDAFSYLKNFNSEKFDIILMDAPCSATGTLRRHPEIVHIKNLQDIERQASLQKDMLTLAANALKTGGILVYCTCSISKLEGEKQISNYLENNAGFAVEPLNSLVPAEISEILTPEGFIRTLPFCLSAFGGMDAFFIAKLKKVA